MDEIKPCPFCGSINTVHLKDHFIDEMGIEHPGHVYCSICYGETSYYWWQKRSIENSLNERLDELMKLVAPLTPTGERNLDILCKRLEAVEETLHNDKTIEMAKATRVFINYIKVADYKKANLQMLVVQSYIDEILSDDRNK